MNGDYLANERRNSSRNAPNNRLHTDRLRRGYARALRQHKFWFLEGVLLESAAGEAERWAAERHFENMVRICLPQECNKCKMTKP